MKTFNRRNREIKKGIVSVFLLITSALMLAGCEKSEQLYPSSGIKSSDAKMIAPYQPITMLIIEHYSMRTSLPDYDVLLRSDGKVIFTGRRNVAYQGIIEFKTSAATVSYIKNLFESGNFFSIQQVPIHWDAPFVATRYSNGIRSKTLIDYNDGMPQMLIQIRKKAEEKLNISKYIYGEVPVPSMPVAL